MRCFSNDFVAPEGRNVGSLKRRVRSGQMRDEKLHAIVVARSKFFGSQKCENSPVQSTFGSWDVQKVHAVEARSTSRSQNVQSTSASDHFWKFRCRKCARRGRAKHVCKSKVLKTEGSEHFASWDVEKVHAVVTRSTFRSQNVQSTPRSEYFWKLRCSKSARRCGAKRVSKSKCTKHLSLGPLLAVQKSKVLKTDGLGALFEFRMWFCVAGARDSALCQKWAKHVFFCISKSFGRRGTCEEDPQRWISPGRRNTRDMFIRDVRRSRRWFPERGGIFLEHQIFRFAKMILRDRCSTSHDLASLFRGKRNV